MIPLPGFVYCDSKFVFSDGTIGKKLFVVLCDSPIDKNNVLVARTTSIPKSDPIYGCHFPRKYEAIFFIPNGSCIFSADTWIRFDYLNEYKSEILEIWYKEGNISLKQTKDMLLCGSESYTMAGWQRDALKAHGDLILT